MKKFDVTKFTDAPKQIQKTFSVQSSIANVWEEIANHEGMTTWIPMIRHVDLVQRGEDGNWGEGCVRHCQFGPDLLKESIVHWDPPHGYAYSIADMHLVKDHVGYIFIKKVQETTVVSWTQYFIPNGNILKNFMAKHVMLPNIMSKALKNLNKKVSR